MKALRSIVALLIFTSALIDASAVDFAGGCDALKACEDQQLRRKTMKTLRSIVVLLMFTTALIDASTLNTAGDCDASTACEDQQFDLQAENR
jgi:hypothetical protein